MDEWALKYQKVFICVHDYRNRDILAQTFIFLLQNVRTDNNYKLDMININIGCFRKNQQQLGGDKVM